MTTPETQQNRVEDGDSQNRAKKAMGILNRLLNPKFDAVEYAENEYEASLERSKPELVDDPEPHDAGQETLSDDELFIREDQRALNEFLNSTGKVLEGSTDFLIPSARMQYDRAPEAGITRYLIAERLDSEGKDGRLESPADPIDWSELRLTARTALVRRLGDLELHHLIKSMPSIDYHQMGSELLKAYPSLRANYKGPSPMNSHMYALSGAYTDRDVPLRELGSDLDNNEKRQTLEETREVFVGGFNLVFRYFLNNGDIAGALDHYDYYKNHIKVDDIDTSHLSEEYFLLVYSGLIERSPSSAADLARSLKKSGVDLYTVGSKDRSDAVRLWQSREQVGQEAEMLQLFRFVKSFLDKGEIPVIGTKESAELGRVESGLQSLKYFFGGSENDSERLDRSLLIDTCIFAINTIRYHQDSFKNNDSLLAYVKEMWKEGLEPANRYIRKYLK